MTIPFTCHVCGRLEVVRADWFADLVAAVQVLRDKGWRVAADVSGDRCPVHATIEPQPNEVAGQPA